MVDYIVKDEVDESAIRNKLYRYYGDFPEPFIKGNKNIVHIKNYNNLCAEGRVMEHCVASYEKDIIQGYSCIYKVLSPQRATLELVKENDTFLIKQLKLKSNTTPSNSTYNYIDKWLEDCTHTKR